MLLLSRGLTIKDIILTVIKNAVKIEQTQWIVVTFIKVSLEN